MLVTIGALLVGFLVVSYSLLSQPSGQLADTLQPPIAEVPQGMSDGRSLGNPGAPVTVDVWADFQCPGCGQLARSVEPPIIDQFVVAGFARLVFHDAAFQGQKSSSSWDESVQSAAGARCAADQGKFWEMHDWLFANQLGENNGAFASAPLRLIAGGAGLNLDSYDKCLAAGDKQQAVILETNQAVASGIKQTPTIELNGADYTGPITVRDLGDAIMAAAGGASPASTFPHS